MVPTDELQASRRSRTRGVVATFVVIGALVGVAVYALRPSTPTRRAPRFELRLLEGGTISSDELRGNPVVMNFFASWCAPCDKEAPILERMWRRYRDDGVRFVGVNVRDTRQDASRFLRKHAITYPVAVDRDEVLTRKLGVHGLPQTFFIDADWNLGSVGSGGRIGTEAGTPVLGAISADELEREIEALLAR